MCTISKIQIADSNHYLHYTYYIYNVLYILPLLTKIETTINLSNNNNVSHIYSTSI